MRAVIDMKRIYSAEYLYIAKGNVIKKGALVVEGNSIADCGPLAEMTKKYPDAEPRHYAKHVIMPGLIDSHTHLALTGFHLEKKYAELGDLMKSASAYHKKTGADVLSFQCLQGMQSSLQHGTTTVVDWRHCGLLPCDSFASIRHIIAFEILGAKEWEQAEKVTYLKQRLADFHAVNLPLTGCAVALHSPYWVAPFMWDQALITAGEYRVPVMTHISETQAELEWVHSGTGRLVECLESFTKIYKPGCAYRTPVDMLAQHRRIARGMIFVHGLYLDDNDLECIKAYQCYLCLCPLSNQILEGRIPDWEVMIDRGIPILLGTDSAAGNYDILEQIRVLLRTKRGLTVRKNFCKTLFNACTLDAARALGIKTGTLSPGNFADFVIGELACGHVDEDDLEFSIVYHTQINEVYCNGKKVVI